MTVVLRSTDFACNNYRNTAIISKTESSTWPKFGLSGSIKKETAAHSYIDIYEEFIELLEITKDHNLNYTFFEPVDEIEYCGLKLKFRREYNLKITFDGKYFNYDCEDYDVYGFGTTLLESLNSFKEDIIIAWKLYVNCDIEELSLDAKEFRMFLLDNLVQLK